MRSGHVAWHGPGTRHGTRHGAPGTGRGWKPSILEDMEDMEDMEDTVSCRNKEAHALAKRTLKMIRGDKQEIRCMYRGSLIKARGAVIPRGWDSVGNNVRLGAPTRIK